jgi:hypothetical protein
MITTAQLHLVFKAIIDEYQSDYFSDALIDSFLNQAQMSLFKKLVNPDVEGTHASGFVGYYETSQKIAQYLAELTRQFEGTTTPSPAKFSTNDVSLLVGGREVYGIGSLEVNAGSGYHPAKWKANSEHAKQQHMRFFAPSACYPYFTISNSEYLMYPDTASGYRGICLVMPLAIATGGQGSELHPALENVLAYKAAELGGISIRDDEFTNNIRLELEKLGV